MTTADSPDSDTEQEIASDEERMRIAILIAEWRQLRRQGVPAGSQCRRVAELRQLLLEVGQWEEIYR